MLDGLFGSGSKQKATKAKSQSANAGYSDTILGTGSSFTGELIAQGNVRIGGSFAGNVTTRGGVVVGNGATLEGDLLCDTAAIAGVVEGNIVARRVAVRATGRVHGDLRLEKLVSDEGSYVQGQITMEQTLDLEALLPQTDTDAVDEDDGDTEEAVETE